VGKRKMEAAIATARASPKLAHLDFEVTWRPFELDPTLPEAGENKMQRYSAKFGAQRMAQMVPYMKSVGAALQPPVSFSYGGVVSNTIASHVVLEAALAEGGPALQDRVVERLFAHYFEKEGDIADRKALLAMALDAGMKPQPIAQMLEDGTPLAVAARAATVRVIEAMRRKYKMNGVPFFVFNDKAAFSGAQDPEAFLEVFEELAGAE